MIILVIDKIGIFDRGRFHRKGNGLRQQSKRWYREGMGKKFERCLWQIQRELFGAAVEKIEDKCKPDDFFGYRKRGCLRLDTSN